MPWPIARERAVSTPDDAMQWLGVPLLAVIPAIEASAGAAGPRKYIGAFFTMLAVIAGMALLWSW